VCWRKKRGLRKDFSFSRWVLEEGLFSDRGVSSRWLALGRVLLMESSEVQKGDCLLFLLGVSCCWRHTAGKD
jgi:hypothetical protein